MLENATAARPMRCTRPAEDRSIGVGTFMIFVGFCDLVLLVLSNGFVAMTQIDLDGGNVIASGGLEELARNCPAFQSLAREAASGAGAVA